MWTPFRRKRQSIQPDPNCCEPGKTDPDLENIRKKEREIAERLRLLDVERQVMRDAPSRNSS